MLAGASAARQLGWPLPNGIWPAELYVPEPDLVELVETHDLELADDGQCDLVLRAVPEPWPFPPHVRVVPDVVAALDLAEATSVGLATLGRARLDELAPGIEPSWWRRPQRQRSVRPMISSGRGSMLPRHRLQASTSAGDELWDKQAERDSRHLVALLFVAGKALRRVEAAEVLRISAGRIERACAFLNLSPPHGLRLEEHADRLELVSAPDCTATIERFLDKPAPEALSQAALEVLAIVAYEQPVSRADVNHIRGTDSSGVVDTLIARGLVADDPPYGSRGRPAFLATTEAFLRHMGVGSLAELPPLPATESVLAVSTVAPA